MSLAAVCSALQQVDLEALDPGRCPDWATSLRDASRQLNDLARDVALRGVAPRSRTSSALDAKQNAAVIRLLQAARELKRDLDEYPRSSYEERRTHVQERVRVSRRTLDEYLSTANRCGLLEESDDELSQMIEDLQNRR